MLSHYAHSIRELGTPDGFNSESPEHLHIHYAKKPYRASNKVKPKPQMLDDLFKPIAESAEEERREEGEDEDEDEWDGEWDGEDEAAPEGGGQQDDGSDGTGIAEGVSQVVLEGNADRDGDHSEHEDNAMPEPNYPGPALKSGKRWTCEVKGTQMGESHGTIDFVPALTNCLSSRLDVSNANELISPHHSFPVWHKVALHHRPLTFAPGEPPQCDLIRARRSPTGQPLGGEFDTVLFIDRADKFGLERYRAGRVRVIFQLPGHLRKAHPIKFVYLELFKPFPASPSPFHRMPATAPQFRHNGQRHTIVLPLTDIVIACHLAPQFKLLSPELRLNSSLDLLSLSPRFFLNPYYNYYTFLLLDHWRRVRARKQGGRE